MTTGSIRIQNEDGEVFLTGREILDLPMEPNDSGGETIREYLIALLRAVWREQAGFSGKRPWGQSDWYIDLARPLNEAGALHIEYHDDGFYVKNFNRARLDILIDAAIVALGVVDIQDDV